MNFLDPALEQFAIRDLDKIVPGRRYALVHLQKPNYDLPDYKYEYDYNTGKYGYVKVRPFPPSAEVVWVTGIIPATQAYPYLTHIVEAEKMVITYRSDSRSYTWDGNPTGISMIYASDAGVWNAPRAYRNDSNYFLDIDLLPAVD